MATAPRKSATRAVKTRKKTDSKSVKANPVGRPSSYKPEFAELAYGFCLLGATDQFLADRFDVNKDTINEWKRVHPEFSDSIAKGRDIADVEIVKALYHRAKGYSHPEVDLKVIQNQIVETPLIKHYPPDTAAASLWLRNRQSANWRDKVDSVVSGPDGGPVQHSVTVKFV